LTQNVQLFIALLYIATIWYYLINHHCVVYLHKLSSDAFPTSNLKTQQNYFDVYVITLHI